MDDPTLALASAVSLIEDATASNRRLADQILAEGQVELTRTAVAVSARVTG